jgi:hypothetical protein
MSRTVMLENMPLRDLLNQMEHRVREFQEHINLDLHQACEELHQMTRPKRRKSSFPTIRNISNGYERFAHALRYADKLMEGIEENAKHMASKLEEVT